MSDWKQRNTWPPKGGAKRALEATGALYGGDANDLRRQRDEALDRAERAEARLGELERNIEEALTEGARREREACVALCMHTSDSLCGKLGTGAMGADACAIAIRARGRE